MRTISLCDRTVRKFHSASFPFPIILQYVDILRLFFSPFSKPSHIRSKFQNEIFLYYIWNIYVKKEIDSFTTALGCYKLMTKLDMGIENP